MDTQKNSKYSPSCTFTLNARYMLLYQKRNCFQIKEAIIESIQSSIAVQNHAKINVRQRDMLLNIPFKGMLQRNMLSLS